MTFGGAKLSGRQPGEREQLESSVKLLLLWVADCDGQHDSSELEYVDAQFPDTQRTVKAQELLEFIHAGDLKRIEQAVRTLGKESREMRLAFLDLAIAMCMADHNIAIAENHVLRFCADALFLGPAILKKRFQAISGQTLPEPGDPGRPEWWDKDGTSGGENRPPDPTLLQG
jgi:uncharacterized tellurite resistance protein B-like protein